MSLVVKLSFEKLFFVKLFLLPIPLLSGSGLIAKKAKRNPKSSKEIPMIPEDVIWVCGIE